MPPSAFSILPGVCLTAPVKAPREPLLAGAALAEQQHRRLGRCELLDHAADLQHGVARGNHPGQGGAGGEAAQAVVLALDRVDAARPVDQHAQHLDVHRLLAEVEGAGADGPQRVLAPVAPGDHDDLGARCELVDRRQAGEALLHAVGVGWQTEILEHHFGLEAAAGGDRLVAGGGELHAIAVERPLQLALQAGVVLDDQQGGLFGLGHRGSIPSAPRSVPRVA